MNNTRYAQFACCIALAACSQATQLPRLQFTPNTDSVVDSEVGPPGYRVLHSFGADHDGSGPTDLINVGNTFYGTTVGGGARYCGYRAGCGTVFSITTNGTEKVLHRFGKATDGWWPAAGLTDVAGTLYGTTEYGGAFDHGTVFSITTRGDEKVLYSFRNRPDGENPSADLIDHGGALYGVTFAGGIGCAAEGCGTVFRITTDGRERVLHKFYTERGGWYPSGDLNYTNGKFYGVTFNGGPYGVSIGGWGTVFSITTGGAEKVLHDFGKGNDGWYPAAGLVSASRALYGTTEEGGSNCGTEGCGTVFSITRGGAEKVLHSFNGIDGGYPEGTLIDVGGTLYGTTEGGGANYCPRDYDGRCGTVFSITTDGKEKVLHSFSKRTDGNGPVAGLTYKSGSLFGTTERGGRYDGGVVFSLTL